VAGDLEKAEREIERGLALAEGSDRTRHRALFLFLRARLGLERGGHQASLSDQTEAMSLLRAESLGKQYKSRKVVTDLSLEVRSGEVVGLLGPNGAGKTTAFYMIVGLIPCDDGRIWLDDRELTALPMYRRARLGLGYLPQEASVFRKLTVEDNIRAILEVRDDLDDEREREAALESLLEELHIGHIRASIGMSLSGGERRRVEIARALAAEPRFILLDEPFAGVDPISVDDIQRIIRHLSSRDIGVLITDHNVRETLGICSRAYIVSSGSVIASGSAEEILANPQVREVYLGQDFRL
jgi:lipopolysaccharide export system ATP-binding protein